MSVTEGQRTSQLAGLERAVIGALIRHPNLFWTHKERIVADLMSDERHKAVIRIMHKRSEKPGNTVFAISAIAAALPPSDDSHEAYLSHCLQNSLNPDAVSDGIEELEDHMYQRWMVDFSQAVMKAATERTELSGRQRFEKARTEFDKLGSTIGRTKTRHVAEVATSLITRTNESFRKEKRVGQTIGLKCVDDLIGPIFPGKVVTIAGAPGASKTALGWKIASTLGTDDNTRGRVRYGTPGIFFSQEMGDEELVARDLAGSTGISSGKIESADLSAGELESLIVESDWFRDSQVHIHDESRLSHKKIRDVCLRMKQTKGLGWIVIDHLLYCGKPSSRMTELEAHTENMMGFKALAKDLGIAVILLAQLRTDYGRGTWRDMRRPEVGDLFGAPGAIFQNSDILLFIHRPEVFLRAKEPSDSQKDYNADHDAWEAKLRQWQGKIEFINGKMRSGAPCRRAIGYFEGARFAFHDNDPTQKQRVPVENEDSLL